MKRLLFALLIGVLCFSLVACNSKDTPTQTDDNSEIADNGSALNGESEDVPVVEDPEIEMAIMNVTYYTTPIIQFGMPEDGSFVEILDPTVSDEGGRQFQNGEFDIYFGLRPQRKYVDGSAVFCSYQEAIEARINDSYDELYEVSYSGMDGYAQDSGSGRITLLLPIEDSLQKDVETPYLLEVILWYNVLDENGMRTSDKFEEAHNAIEEFIATEEVQMILNSIELIQG